MMWKITVSRHFESVKRTVESIVSAEIAKNTRLATRHCATGSSGDRDVGVMNVIRSWDIEAPLSPLSPENLTEWLGYAAPLTKINYICWKIFQHFFPSPTLSTRLSFFFFFWISSLFWPSSTSGPWVPLLWSETHLSWNALSVSSVKARSRQKQIQMVKEKLGAIRT